jgi:hypothetical protein
MVRIALIALLLRDREQHRFRTNRYERFAQPWHAVEGPTINRVEPRYDMDGTKRAGQGLGPTICRLDRTADGTATNSRWSRQDYYLLCLRLSRFQDQSDTRVEGVEWAERSETHHFPVATVGFTALNPPYLLN